jgi:hypothetical protein
MLRISHCLDNRLTDGGKVVSLTQRSRSAPKKHSFSVSDNLLEAEQTPEPSVAGQIRQFEKFT